jgi:hypothetical protein
MQQQVWVPPKFEPPPPAATTNTTIAPAVGVLDVSVYL